MVLIMSSVIWQASIKRFLNLELYDLSLPAKSPIAQGIPSFVTQPLASPSSNRLTNKELSFFASLIADMGNGVIS
jgi:hypothetical protein